jgi:hypothetical protein
LSIVIIWLQRNLESSFNQFSKLAFIINSEGNGDFMFDVKRIIIIVGDFELNKLFCTTKQGLIHA